MTDRYFLQDAEGGTYREVTADQFVQAERDAGFRPKPGCGPFATAGFGTDGSGGYRRGRIVRDNSFPADMLTLLPPSIWANATHNGPAQSGDGVSLTSMAHP